MRVLVTGGAGFIGSHVAIALSEAGHDVSSLDSLHPAAHTGATQVGEHVRVGDIRDPHTVAHALRGVDVVVHQAAMVGMGVDLDDLPDYVSCNDLGTAVLLAGMARAGIRKLVLASSMVVYGEGAYLCDRDGPVKPRARSEIHLTAGRFEPSCPHCGQTLVPALVSEDDRLEPRSVYAATKVAQEHLAAAWARQSGANATVLRYHNVYGPGMPRDTPYAGVAAIFRSSLERGRPPQVFEDGGQLRDFVHVVDVARANVCAVAALAGRIPAGPRTYNIASGEPHTILDMATALSTAFNGPTPVVTGDYRVGDVRHVLAAPGRARNDLDFSAETPFKVGMAHFADAPLRV